MTFTDFENLIGISQPFPFFIGIGGWVNKIAGIVPDCGVIKKIIVYRIPILFPQHPAFIAFAADIVKLFKISVITVKL